MDTLLGSGRFLARRPPLALAPRCSRGSPEKGGGSDKGIKASPWWFTLNCLVFVEMPMWSSLLTRVKLRLALSGGSVRLCLGIP